MSEDVVESVTFDTGSFIPFQKPVARRDVREFGVYSAEACTMVERSSRSDGFAYVNILPTRKLL